MLFHGIIDYAGMFPPAGLPIADAIASYRRYRSSPYAWMLGSIVLSSARLGDLGGASLGLDECGGMSIVISGDPRTELAKVVEFLATRRSGRANAAIEFPPVGASAMQTLVSDVSAGSRTFFEIPVDDELDERLDAVARCRASAKIRTGGVTADAFPPSEAVYRFFRACADRRIPCKATAGLHHAVTGRYPLTYEQGSPVAVMYGFLNVCALAALVWRGADEATCVDALRESSPDAFGLQDDALSWQGHRLSTQDLASMRQGLFRSFGSCSFVEPVEELQGMRLV